MHYGSGIIVSGIFGSVQRCSKAESTVLGIIRNQGWQRIYIHPASRGVAAHTAGLFRSVRGAKGGVEYEEQSSTGELTYITAGFVNIFLSGRSPSCGISNS